MPRLPRRSRKPERREQYAQSGASSDDTRDGDGDMLTDRYGLALSGMREKGILAVDSPDHD